MFTVIRMIIRPYFFHSYPRVAAKLISQSRGLLTSINLNSVFSANLVAKRCNFANEFKFMSQFSFQDFLMDNKV
ncbi:hypothetical protein RJT34_06254 [Clitoria ternatea]|uniref:Uncharacterized protein n=1 Tax=Clitoria ternatea TaxID=43366 RepID=A0AAN9K3Y2_CLITE